MVRLIERSRNTAVVTAALLATGCGSAVSTQQTGAEVPNSTPFSVYTHCGVENVRIDGRWWHAKPPLYNAERSGPPAGWGDPYQDGTLTIESPDRAVFEALGQEVVFVPAPENEPVRVCR
jgi:hypothetical protein